MSGVEMWYATNYGARCKRTLPITYDSIKAADTRLNQDELLPGKFFTAKPAGSYGPIWMRLYHGWLVLTGKAFAVQFTEDHLRMAGIEVTKHG